MQSWFCGRLQAAAALHHVVLIAQARQVHGRPRVVGARAPQRAHELGERGEGQGELEAAQVEGDRAEVFAGAGLVEASRADAEYAETELKLRTLLSALKESE